MRQNTQFDRMLVCALCLMAGAANADTFEWSPTVATPLWGSAVNWTRTAGSSRTYPNASGDIAMLVRDVGGSELSNCTVFSGTSYTVGKFVFAPKAYYYSKVTVQTGYNATSTLALKDPSGTVTIEFTGKASEVKFGNRYNVGLLKLDLQNDLLITHALASGNDVSLGFAADAQADTCQFMTTLGKRDITIPPTPH